MARINKTIGALAAVGLLLAGCGAEDDEPDEIAAEEPPTDISEDGEGTEDDDPCPIDGDRRLVNAECVDPWPLTVDEGEAWCDDDLPYVDADGTTWGLTGAAYTQGEGRELDDSIWADNPDIEGTKVNVSALRDTALELC